MTTKTWPDYFQWRSKTISEGIFFLLYHTCTNDLFQYTVSALKHCSQKNLKQDFILQVRHYTESVTCSTLNWKRHFYDLRLQHLVRRTKAKTKANITSTVLQYEWKCLFSAPWRSAKHSPSLRQCLWNIIEIFPFLWFFLFLFTQPFFGQPTSLNSLITWTLWAVVD